jgi:hypothetical protein
MSNLFLNKYPFWIRDGSVDRKVITINELYNSETGQNFVDIDSRCAKVILLLNQKGFPTQFHCSGVSSDHRFWDYELITFEQSLKCMEEEGYSFESAKKIILEEALDKQSGYIAFSGLHRGILNILPDEFLYEEMGEWKTKGKRSVIRIPHQYGDRKKIALWNKFSKVLKEY